MVGQIDLATKQNASLVGQSAAAAESLKDRSDRLVGAASLFRRAGEAARMAKQALAG